MSAAARRAGLWQVAQGACEAMRAAQDELSARINAWQAAMAAFCADCEVVAPEDAAAFVRAVERELDAEAAR